MACSRINIDLDIGLGYDGDPSGAGRMRGGLPDVEILPVEAPRIDPGELSPPSVQPPSGVPNADDAEPVEEPP
jgi:hypothetical protein